MDIKSKHKVDSAFSMSSMTDIVFLLLIFFMLTSSFITPSGLVVSLPTSAASSMIMQKNSLTITEELRYRLNETDITADSFEAELARLVNGEEGTLSLNIDASVPVGIMARVGGIAAKLKQKTILVTKPE
ncbi:MAG: biopolymer transport protein ExbD [Nonlabens sp.]|jgi:biopolymer transport protein ExbD